MSAELVVYALLSGAAPVAAIVAGRIRPVVLRMGDKHPALVYSLVDAVREPALDAQASAHLTRSRVQVDLIAADFAQLLTLRAAVITALQHQRGVIGGVLVNALMPDFEGPVTFDAQLEVYHRPLDFIVFTHQST